MKKLIFTFIVVSFSVISFGQINKGAWMIGANSNLNYSNYSFKGSSQTSSVFNINSRAGYFVANNFALGLNLGYLNVGSSGGSSSSYTTIGVFVRGFVSKSVFLGGGFNSTSITGSSSYTTYPFELGLAAFITDYFAIEPSLVYTASDGKGGVPILGIPSSAVSAFGLNVGFTFYLNRVKE